MGRRKERRLDIFMNGEKVGTWDWSRGPSELVYDESWLASPRGRPISLSLPWRPGNLPVQGAVVAEELRATLAVTGAGGAQPQSPLARRGDPAPPLAEPG